MRFPKARARLDPDFALFWDWAGETRGGGGLAWEPPLKRRVVPVEISGWLPLGPSAPWRYSGFSFSPPCHASDSPRRRGCSLCILLHQTLKTPSCHSPMRLRTVIQRFLLLNRQRRSQWCAQSRRRQCRQPTRCPPQCPPRSQAAGLILGRTRGWRRGWWWGGWARWTGRGWGTSTAGGGGRPGSWWSSHPPGAVEGLFATSIFAKCRALTGKPPYLVGSDLQPNLRSTPPSPADQEVKFTLVNPRCRRVARDATISHTFDAQRAHIHIFAQILGIFAVDARSGNVSSVECQGKAELQFWCICKSARGGVGDPRNMSPIFLWISDTFSARFLSQWSSDTFSSTAWQQIWCGKSFSCQTRLR